MLCAIIPSVNQVYHHPHLKIRRIVPSPHLLGTSTLILEADQSYHTLGGGNTGLARQQITPSSFVGVGGSIVLVDGGGGNGCKLSLASLVGCLVGVESVISIE